MSGGHDEALVTALAHKYDIQEYHVVEIGTALLKDIHRVAVQDEHGPMGALYEAKWLLDEEGQYHLTGIVIELLRSSGVDTGELVADLFRYVSPERDLWNEQLRQWLAARSETRKAIDGDAE